MKKTLCIIMMSVMAITGFSQNYFEAFVEPEEPGVFHEADFVVETPDHGFIVSCRAQYIYQNDILLKISPEGEVTNRLVFQIDGKSIKYCGLFNETGREGGILAIAVLTEGVSSTNYIQNELAFLRFDADLNLTSQRTICLGDDYICLSTSTDRDLPRFVIEEGGTFFMAAHCMKTNYKCYLFARITSDGDIVSLKEDLFYDNYVVLSDVFVRDKSAKSYGVIIIHSNTSGDYGGEYCHYVDSSLDVKGMKRLMSFVYGTVQANPQQQYPDTTFSYIVPSGSGLSYDDSTFMITGQGRFVNYNHFGWCQFITRVNDSLDALDYRTWDCVERKDNQESPSRWSAGVKALSVAPDSSIYHCGMNGFTGISNHNQIHYNPTPSKIVISKFDRHFNLLWRRYYGVPETFYDINVIQATEDGGCIITGSSSFKSNYNYIYAYALKTDADGYLGIDENYDIEVKPYFCYPNPVKDIIYIEFSPDVTCRTAEIYSMDGKLVKSQASNLETIDIFGLTSGVYVMKVRMSDGSEFSERIVKQ